MTARVDRLGAGDLMTLWAEAPATPMHIALAGLLDPGPLLDRHGRLPLDELRAAIEARLARAPELRRRIRRTGFGQGRPAVVDDQRFAIARHVTAVDLDGCDEEGFWTWCASHALEPLDRDHPLWRVTFASGLACGPGRGAGGHAPRPGRRHRRGYPGRAPARPGPGHPRRHPAVAAGAAAGPAGPAWRCRRSLDRRGRHRAAAASPGARRRPGGRPGRRRDEGRRRPAGPGHLAAAAHRPGPAAGRRPAPLRQVKEAGHAHGATVNDVLLAAVASGLHRLLAGRGDPVEGLELRVSVPVGAPGGARNAGGSTPMVLPLPVGDLGPVDRLARISATTRAAKAGRDRGYQGLLASPLLPTTLLRLAVAWLARHGGSRVNLYVINVPGPPQPLWLRGGRLDTAVPIAPLVAGVPLAVAALSYAGELVVSIQVDGAVDDLDVLANGVSEGLDQLISRERSWERVPAG